MDYVLNLITTVSLEEHCENLIFHIEATLLEQMDIKMRFDIFWRRRCTRPRRP